MKYLTAILLVACINATALAKKQINTHILINTTPDNVWSILTNFDSYPEWNPFIKSIKGEVKPGKKITVRIEPPQSKGMTFKPTVRTLEPNKELTWIGHFLFKGLFDGYHTFELIDNGNGTTTLKQSEEFKGVFVWMFNTEKTKKGFEEMNSKIKALAEQ